LTEEEETRNSLNAAAVYSGDSLSGYICANNSRSPSQVLKLMWRGAA